MHVIHVSTIPHKDQGLSPPLLEVFRISTLDLEYIGEIMFLIWSDRALIEELLLHLNYSQF